MSEWISLEQTKPPIGEPVLVHIENWNQPAILKYQTFPFERMFDPSVSRWYWYPERMHWMPLPEAPPKPVVAEPERDTRTIDMFQEQAS